MSRYLMSAATAALLAAQMLSGAQAATITYDLALNNTFGPESGTGAFTINGPIASNGASVFTAGGGLTSLNFLIDGRNFTLADELFNANVTFNNGQLINIAYAGFLNGVNLALGTVGLGYQFFAFNDGTLNSSGTISASATPLPPTWTMMLIGLTGFGFILYRRSRRGDGAMIAA